MVAVAPGLGLERQEIRARVRLAVALPERRLAAGDRRQHLTPQALGAVLDDRVGGLPAAGERPEGRTGERQLFHQNELHEHRLLSAAVRRRPAHAEPALRAERLQKSSRVRPRAVSRVHAVDRECLEWVRAEESADLLDERLFCLAEVEVHRVRRSG